MYHKELIEVAQKRLCSDTISIPTSFLDLGCGDAYFVSHVFDKETSLHYTGVDLSESALKDARENLEEHSKWNVNLHCGDLLSFLKQNKVKFQVASCGFSLHHLSTEDKRAVFEEVKRSLLPGGLFLLYDVVRDQETRDEINKVQIERYKKRLGNHSQRFHEDGRDAYVE